MPYYHLTLPKECPWYEIFFVLSEVRSTVFSLRQQEKYLLLAEIYFNLGPFLGRVLCHAATINGMAYA